MGTMRKDIIMKVSIKLTLQKLLDSRYSLTSKNPIFEENSKVFSFWISLIVPKDLKGDPSSSQNNCYYFSKMFLK